MVKNKSLFLVGSAVILVLCFASIIFMLKGCQKKQVIKGNQTVRVAPDKYDILVKSWNKCVNRANLGSEFYLKQLNPESSIGKLNLLVKPFFTQFNQNIEDEFAKLKKENKYSLFILYRNFLNRYYNQQKKIISTSMTSSEVKKILYNLTKNDDLNKKTVQIIAAMQNPCQFLEIYRRNLYKQGLDGHIKTCNEITIDKDKYPLIYSLFVDGK